MRFGQVEGIVTQDQRAEGGRLKLTVYLDTGRQLEVVREEALAPLRPVREPADLVWHADQWTQETIGIDLAEQGWEVISAGPLPDPAPGEVARSATYAVRNLTPVTWPAASDDER